MKKGSFNQVHLQQVDSTKIHNSEWPPKSKIHNNPKIVKKLEAKNTDTTIIRRRAQMKRIQEERAEQRKKKDQEKQEFLKQFRCKTVPFGAGKTCAIVGNAFSLSDNPSGHIIDQHDVIVRINKLGTQRSDLIQGSRTDIIFVHNLTLLTLGQREVAKYVIVNVAEDIPDILQEWSDRIQQDYVNEEVRLTTGFLSVIAMMQYDYKISLFGFDFFATPTYYNYGNTIHRETNHFAKHRPQWEKQILLPLIEKHNEKFCNNTEE